MIFKEVVSIHWESEDGRFRIEQAYSSGFVAKDTEHTRDMGFYGTSFEHEFTNTYEEAVKWCEGRQ